ncbi:MAG: hypothetical protein JXM79_22225 [Sedimentisphaerales bacterium]|nr:hypothetical protein [Sedimentisphaerales bacterium]
MLRKCVFSMTVALLLSSGVFACIGHAPSSIGHAQDFGIDAVNVVQRAGCVGSAEGSNTAMVSHTQEAYNTASGTSAVQEETGILTQSGTVEGRGGRTIVAQNASVDGAQEQLIGPAIGCCASGLSSQTQSLGVSLDMLTKNAGRIGTAIGSQAFVGAQSQIEITPNSMSASSQFLGAAQYSAVSGVAASVTNILDVVLNQSQSVAGGH